MRHWQGVRTKPGVLLQYYVLLAQRFVVFLENPESRLSTLDLRENSDLALQVAGPNFQFFHHRFKREEKLNQKAIREIDPPLRQFRLDQSLCGVSRWRDPTRGGHSHHGFRQIIPQPEPMSEIEQCGKSGRR